MIIITAPSGAGKTTIVRHLLKTFDFLGFSVSVTTRDKREHETEGKDYYFVSPDRFKELIADSELAEYEEVYENQFYGTLKSEIERVCRYGTKIIFDIDVKGAINLKKQYGESALAIFISPPSLEVLEERLINRKTESDASLRKRLARVREEMKYIDRFDTVLVNDKLNVALEEAELKILRFFYPNSLLAKSQEEE
jgi:guanylate kinase